MAQKMATKKVTENVETETPENVETVTPENVDASVENVSSDNDRLTMLEIRVDHLLHSEEHKRRCVDDHG